MYIIVCVKHNGSHEVTAIANGAKDALNRLIEFPGIEDYTARTIFKNGRMYFDTESDFCGISQIICYNQFDFIKAYVWSEEIDNFLFYYLLAEGHKLERKYLQCILNGMSPLEASFECGL